MKFLLAIIAGLFVSQGVATGLRFDATGCNADRNSLGCQCSGGSGNYTWRFTDLPEGWQAQGDRIYPRNGKWDDKKLYGAKVELYDNVTKQALKKSLFFRFNNGQFKAVDDDYNFDANNFLSQIKNNVAVSAPSYGTNYAQQKQQQHRWNNVRNIFNEVDSIGGGVGLDRLSPFFQGRGQFRYDQWNNNVNNVVNNQVFVPNQVVNNYRQERQEGFVPNVVTNYQRPQLIIEPTVYPLPPAPVYTQTYTPPVYTPPVYTPPVYTPPVYTPPVYTPVVDNTPVYTQTYPTKDYEYTEYHPTGEYHQAEYRPNQVVVNQPYAYNQFIPSNDVGSVNVGSSVQANYAQTFDGFDVQGQNYFDDYTEKVYGTGFRGYKNSLRKNDKNRRIRVSRCNIFHPDWIKTYGNPWDRNENDRFDSNDRNRNGIPDRKESDRVDSNDRNRNGIPDRKENGRVDSNDKNSNGIPDWQESKRRFDADDFKCNERDSKVKSYRGQIKSIRGNVVRVVNSKNEQCDVILGSCTNVETADGYMPKVGHSIFWRGVRRDNKQYAEIEAHHATCFEK